MGPLQDVKVVELSDEWSAWAGKLLAELGADVIVVEPPEGSPQRRYGPFVDDVPGDERSLCWWHYNTSKRGVVLDHGDPRLRALIESADILLATGPIERAGLPRGLITISFLVPDDATDLTVWAEGGPVWMCGYDDHDLPPVRGGGNQAVHTA